MQDCHKAPDVGIPHTYVYVPHTSTRRSRFELRAQLRCEGGGHLVDYNGSTFGKNEKLPIGTEGIWVTTMRDARQTLLGKSFRQVRLVEEAWARQISVARIEYRRPEITFVHVAVRLGMSEKPVRAPARVATETLILSGDPLQPVGPDEERERARSWTPSMDRGSPFPLLPVRAAAPTGGSAAEHEARDARLAVCRVLNAVRARAVALIPEDP